MALEFTQSKKFQLWIHRLYGWGASLVLLGALFKLQYWPGAGIMLSIGMITETIIFFLSAFEPMEKKYHWENVYPEILEESDMDEETAASVSAAQQRRGAVPTVAAGTPQINIDLDIDKEQTDRLKNGLERLGSTIDQLTGLAVVAEASARLTENLDKASNSVGEISSSAERLSESYMTTAVGVSNINEQAKKDIETMQAASSGYKEQMTVLGKSLAAVNASFELQLQDNEHYRQNYGALNNEVGSLVGSVQKSVEQTQLLTTDMASLNDNVSKLNTVYGSMLTAVTSVLNK